MIFAVDSMRFMLHDRNCFKKCPYYWEYDSMLSAFVDFSNFQWSSCTPRRDFGNLTVKKQTVPVIINSFRKVRRDPEWKHNSNCQTAYSYFSLDSFRIGVCKGQIVRNYRTKSNSLYIIILKQKVSFVHVCRKVHPSWKNIADLSLLHLNVIEKTRSRCQEW